MVYRVLADAVVVVHFGFIVFVAVGPLLAWRCPRLVWFHLPALAWAAAAVTIGVRCPLTPLEKRLRELAGEEGYDGGFVDHYIENVIYPGGYTAPLRVLAAVLIAVGYVGLRHQAHTRRDPLQVLGPTSRPMDSRPGADKEGTTPLGSHPSSAADSHPRTSTLR